MADVPLNFIPPGEEGVTALLIYESGAQAGPFVPIETVTAVGTYPDYITEYMTSAATAADDWFTISWLINGIETEMSQPIKGGTTTLVQKIIDRVRDRDRFLSERVVAQEAEAAIQQAFGDNVDPYDSALVASTSYRKLMGLVYLTMARSYVFGPLAQGSSSVESATMGLVSIKESSSTTDEKAIQKLLDLANAELGLSTSYVMLMEDAEEAQYITYDHSRLVSGWLAIE